MTNVPADRQLASYEYALPAAQIAKVPAANRHGSKLLVLDRARGHTEHRNFLELPEILRPGDLLVLNETRVLPARLRGRRPSGGAAEVLLVRPVDPAADRDSAREWVALVRPSARIAEGTILRLSGAGAERTTLRVGAVAESGMRCVEFLEAPAGGVLARFGEMPLPPYIDRPATASDRESYQTIYSRVPGAVAAPTAGLHFSAEVLRALAGRGVETARLVLHVGPGTFRPIVAEDVAEHHVDPEWCEISAETRAAIVGARSAGRRVVAVGTTVTRSLEAMERGTAAPDGGFRGWVDLYIRPPFEFRVVQALLTNFHLPKSSLLVLVSAFAGRERVLAAYAEAVARNYRFYSYGDAMLIT